MNSYFNLVKPSYIENWPSGLINHSISTVHFKLTDEQVHALIACNYSMVESGFVPSEEEKAALKELEKILDRYIVQFPKGAFIRLGSRSPKDSYNAYKRLYCYHSGLEAIDALCDSERIHDDLHLAKVNNYTPHLVVREWVKIEPWQEFRAFYKNRKLVGVSQYNYLSNDVYPEIEELKDTIIWAIEIKSKMLAPLFPVDDIVADYIYKVQNRGSERISEVVLLEINPFMVYTDPCLFDWSKDSFEIFEFRYNKE